MFTQLLTVGSAQANRKQLHWIQRYLSVNILQYMYVRYATLRRLMNWKWRLFSFINHFKPPLPIISIGFFREAKQNIYFWIYENYALGRMKHFIHLSFVCNQWNRFYFICLVLMRSLLSTKKQQIHFHSFRCKTLAFRSVYVYYQCCGLLLKRWVYNKEYILWQRNTHTSVNNPLIIHLNIIY